MSAPAQAPAPVAPPERVRRCADAQGRRRVRADNYYVTRANALEDNIRLYTVRSGHRRQLASFDGKVTANVWHKYRVVAKGDHVEVYWDGARVLDHHDPTFA